MKLIDEQAAIDALDVGAEFLRRVLDCTDIVGVEREKYEWGLGLIESYISDMKELPSADAVPVVRCKDCRFADAYYHCVYTNFWESAEDYCSRGERKTNG